MTECFVYDTVRTPRGKGRKDGALHEVTALELGSQVLRNIRDRNKLDTSIVDDVIFGCVDPLGTLPQLYRREGPRIVVAGDMDTMLRTPDCPRKLNASMREVRLTSFPTTVYSE